MAGISCDGFVRQQLEMHSVATAIWIAMSLSVSQQWKHEALDRETQGRIKLPCRYGPSSSLLRGRAGRIKQHRKRTDDLTADGSISLAAYMDWENGGLT